MPCSRGPSSEAVLLGRSAKVDTLELLDALAAGKKTKQIARELGCHWVTVRRRLARHVKASGFKTPEQAVAHHVAERIKARVPLAVQVIVEQVAQRWR